MGEQATKRRAQRLERHPGTNRAVGRVFVLLGALTAIGLAGVPANAGTYDPVTAWSKTVTFCPPASPRPMYYWEMGVSTGYTNLDYWDVYDATNGTWTFPAPEGVNGAGGPAPNGGRMLITGTTTATAVLVETIDIFYVDDGQPSLDDPITAQATLHLPQDLTLCPAPPPSPQPSTSPLPSPSPTPTPVPSPSPTPVASPTTSPASPPTAGPTPSHSAGGTTASPSQTTPPPKAAMSSPYPSPTRSGIPPVTGSGSGSPPNGGDTPWWVWGIAGGLVAVSGLGLGGSRLLRHGFGRLPWLERR